MEDSAYRKDHGCFHLRTRGEGVENKPPVQSSIDKKRPSERNEDGLAREGAHDGGGFALVRPGASLSSNPAALARRAQIRGVVYLLLDRSASMADKGKMQGLYRGALNLFTEARRRDYAVGIVAFDDRAELVLRATCDGTRFWSRLSRLEPHGHTAMHRGIRLATRLLRHKAGERTILLVTDGMPDDREATLAAARLARAEGISLIAIGIGHADEAFLSTLTPKPELAEKVATSGLAKALENVLRLIPHKK